MFINRKSWYYIFVSCLLDNDLSNVYCLIMEINDCSGYILNWIVYEIWVSMGVWKLLVKICERHKKIGGEEKKQIIRFDNHGDGLCVHKK